MMQGNEGRRMVAQNRKLGKQVRTYRCVVVVLVIIIIFLTVGWIWCLKNHRGNGYLCTVCQNPENECACASVIDDLTADNMQKDEEIKVLNEQINHEYDDGLCHRACPIHCPECMHENTSALENETWKPVGEKYLCGYVIKVTTVICNDCGEVLDYSSDAIEDTEHNFEDNVCTDCGYEKEEVKPTKKADDGTKATKKPTARPTSKPTKAPTSKPANPTAKPTEKVTVAPTVKPTENPTVKPTEIPTEKPTTAPTTKPTEAPTQCPHKNTSVDKEKHWSAVGTEDICGQITVDTIEKCKDCGKELHREGSSSYDYNHEFSGRTCSKCGYKKPLAQGSGKAEGEITPPRNSWEYDDGEVANPVSEND